MAENETPAIGNPTQPAPRKKKRWWLRIVLALLVLIVLLIVFAPSIASTSPVRSIVVGKINENLNGKLSIEDWSIGWFSGLDVHGVKIDDIDGSRVIEIARVRVPIPLMKAIKGDYDIGDTIIDKPTLVAVKIDENGVSNLEKLAKSQPPAKTSEPAKPGAPSGPSSKLPNVRGTLTINELRGTINQMPKAGETAPPTLYIDPSNIVVKIPDINSPIHNDIKLVYRVSEAPAGTISLVGDIDAIDSNEVNLDKLSADEKLDLTNVALAAAQPFMKDLKLGGVANGAMQLKADGTTKAAADGAIVVTDFSASGDALKGDRFATSKINLPIKVSRDGTLLKFESLRVEIPDQQFIAEVTGQTSQEALENLVANKAPGADGNLAVTLDAKDITKIANQLRNTIGLQKEVELTSGSFLFSSNLTLTKESATAKQKIDLAASGKNNGQPITLAPVHLDLDATAIPSAKGIPDLRDIKLALTSEFAKASGGGQSLADLNLAGDATLEKLQQQIGQFVDMGTAQLRGAMHFEITSKGDIATTFAPHASVTLTNLAVRGIKDQPDLEQSRLEFTADANVVRGQTNFIDKITSGKVTLQTGDEKSPVVDVDASATNVAGDFSRVESFELAKFNVNDLPTAQKQFGAFVAALKEMTITSGALYTTASGSYDGKTVALSKPLEMSIRSLGLRRGSNEILKKENLRTTIAGAVTLGKDIAGSFKTLDIKSDSNLVTLAKAGDGDLQFKMSEKGGIAGNGTLKIGADLKRVNDVAQAWGGQVAVANSAGQLTSGILDATLTLNHPENADTTVSLNGTVDQLGVTTAQQPITNEKITLALNASSPNDMSGVSIKSGKIDSSFANVTIGETRLKLDDAPTIWDKLVAAKVDVAIADLPKAYAVANAFSPPSTQPVDEQLAIKSGGATANLEIKRDNNVTHVTATNVRATKVSIARGKNSYAFDRPIDLKLAADITPAGDKIKQISITQLGGDLGVATIEMPQAITLKNLDTDKLDANGKVQISGALTPVTKLLAVLQGGEPMPYSGDFVVVQNVQTDFGKIRFDGDVAATKFVVFQDGKAAFSEDRLTVRNDLVLDLDNKTATIKQLLVDMPSSQALGVKIAGAISDWETQRKLSNMTCDLSYDLEKIWPIIKPMLAPETQETYKELKISGKFAKKINLGGSYPVHEKWNESIKFLAADGGIGIGRLETSGLDISYPEIPFTLSNGQLITVYANKPKAERAPKPGTCNGGSIDIGSAVVDLGLDTPRLSIGKNQQLMKDVKLNPILADSMGKFASFLFKDAKDASGLMSVTVVECNNVPLGDIIAQDTKGQAKLAVSITELRLDGPVLKVAGQVLQLGNEGIVGEVKNSSIGYANGQTTSDLSIFLTRKGVQVPLRFTGGIGLGNFDLRNAVLNIPPELLGSKELVQAFPKGIQLPIKGTTSKYQIADLGKIVQQNLGGVIGGILEGQLNKDKDKDKSDKTDKKQSTPSTKSSGDKNDPLGGLIDIIGGNKKDEEKKPDSTPAPAPKKKPKK